MFLHCFHTRNWWKNSWWQNGSFPSRFVISKDKRCTNKILNAFLFEFNFVLFKILQIKNIPSHHFESVHLCHEWAWPKSTGYKVVSFVINVAYFKHILRWSYWKELLFTLAEEAIRSSKYITRTKPLNSQQEAYTAKIIHFTLPSRNY